jgi:dCTP deaminase
MILSDRDIKKYISSGKIVITPTPDFSTQLGSCAVDLRLGKRVRYQVSSIKEEEKDEIVLAPGQFCLGITEEYVEIPDDMCGMLHGRSSLGRKGLMIHSTAPMIEAGFQGRIVLELYNAGPEPIVLKAGERVCALSFEMLSSTVDVPYHKKKSAKYHKQNNP